MHFRPDLYPHLVPHEGLYLVGQGETIFLQEPRFIAVAPWLTGDHTADQIAHHLRHQLPPAETYYALGLLQQKGYVLGDEPPPPPPTIALRAIGRTTTNPLANLLAQHGATIAPDPTTADLTIALTDDYLRPALAELNQTMLAAQRPWLLVRPWGREIWLGPHFTPSQTGCWHCLATRLRGQRPTERYLQQRLATAEPMAPAPPSTAAQEAIAWGLIWSMGVQNPPVGQLFTLDPRTLQVARHPVAARPQCPACGQPTWVAHNQQTPPAFAPTPKLAGQRGVPTAELLPQLEPLLSPLTGLVGHLHHQPLGPAHSYTAEANLALPLADVGRLRRTVRGRAGGKGTTPAEARLGALAESIERYAGVWQGDEPTITAPLADLEGAIHPHDLLFFSPRQYAERAAWNGRGSLYNHVPEPFAAAQPTEWSRVWEVATGRPRYIPTALAYYGRETPFGRADSNGCAAGATVAEAFVQGFCELVERDSVAMWWYNRARRPLVDVASFGHPYLQAVLAHHATLGRDLWVLDITADLGLPTFVAVSRQITGPERLALGFGCHLEAATAVTRAVAELHQLLPALAHSAASHEPAAQTWWQSATLANQPYLAPDPTQAVKTAQDYPALAAADVATDAQWCVQTAVAHSLTPLILDQTRPDVPLRVVRVVVPGLRHFWARLAPGRLYDVPVRLGWLEQNTAEEALNPIGMFL